MIHIIITSYNEPKSTLRAVDAFLQQDIKDKFEIIVVDPFVQVQRFLKKELRDKRVRFFLDPGEGKSYALNLLMQEYGSSNTNDLFILTDGDVYVSQKAVSEIVGAFEDSRIGCVTGRPVSLNDRSTKYGYWSHLFFAGIDRVRSKLSTESKFFECSGYLFAIRKGVILEFPLKTSEDSIIPYLFWKKGYIIKYAPRAEVYVKNPSSWRDWVNQKVRNIKAHENLRKIAPHMPRTKSFLNEIKWGALFAASYPRNIKEYLWTMQAYLARLYLYALALKEVRERKGYIDGWRGEATTESTKTLD